MKLNIKYEILNKKYVNEAVELVKEAYVEEKKLSLFYQKKMNLVTLYTK